MLDVVLLAKVVLVGAIVAAAVMLLANWDMPRPWRRSACWSWAIGAGILAASGATDQWPHLPALEDRARLLTLLVPLTILVETLAARLQTADTALANRAAWLFRFGLMATAAPILLQNSVYLTDHAGRNSAEWSLPAMTIVFCGLAALLALVWNLLSRLQRRTSAQAVHWLLALDALATAVTVMLSGYYRAGLLGLGLAGAIAGATLVSHITQAQSPGSGSLGMSVIGIFAVVLMGRFFSALPTGLAACLVLAPFLAWTFELPTLRKLGPGLRGAGRLACVAIPLLVVVIIAQRRFTAASAARSRPFEPNAIRQPIEK